MILALQSSSPSNHVVRRTPRGRFIARVCGALLAEIVRGFLASWVTR
jgi:hypothetical protein